MKKRGKDSLARVKTTRFEVLGGSYGKRAFYHFDRWALLPNQRSKEGAVLRCCYRRFVIPLAPSPLFPPTLLAQVCSQASLKVV